MDLNILTVGTSVNIKRSNGRVHSAAVSSVDKETNYVSVEWYENDETKGKEVAFQQIYELNKELFVKPKQVPNLKPVEVKVQKSAADRRTIATPQMVQRPQRAVSDNVRAGTPPNGKKPGKNNSGIPVRSNETAPPPLRGRSADSIEQQVPRQPIVKAQSRLAEVQQEVAGESSKDKPSVVKSRKSNCVKEVEKLKKNREVRRAKQAEQVAIRNEDYDPTNPNWEFLKKIHDFQSTIQIQPLSGEEAVVSQKICVCVRKRPLNKKETGRKEVDVITVPDVSSTYVHEPKTKVDLTKYIDNQRFVFDYSFNENVTNETVYKFTAQPLVHTIFDRGMATCFAYGQTGSGKTHTMGGAFDGKEQDATRGIYALAAADVFLLNSQPGNAKKGLSVSASFFEIYSGKLFDLLNVKARLRILEDAKQQVQVVGLTEDNVKSVEDVLALIQTGNKCRTSGTTSANQNSSRSHAVFQIILRKRSNGKMFGKFSLIDLAGNERGADTASADRKTRMEGAEINKSLLALKECIRALGRQGAHLPFRGSKLTQVLKDSFVGDKSRTCMIAMISPGLNSCEHTLNTLRYADRVKELKSNALPLALPSEEESQAAAGRQDPQDDGRPPPMENDLHYLHRSLQHEDGSVLDMDRSSDLLLFHEAINNLVESEEQLIEEHKSIIQADQYLLEEEAQLLQYVGEVDHDIEEYVTHMERIVSEKVERLSRFKARIQDLKQRLQDEESASRNVKVVPKKKL
ncbi:kinesin-like protein KIF2A [Halichondria panicea]|uniref:kinesin-like protein KIF2A n=1 Tax=Halichondria panicea TaxID=6063 RepID=UPI00312B72FC